MSRLIKAISLTTPAIAWSARVAIMAKRHAILRFTLCRALNHRLLPMSMWAHSHVSFYSGRGRGPETGPNASLHGTLHTPSPQDWTTFCSLDIHIFTNWTARSACSQTIPFVCVLRFRIYTWFQPLWVFNVHWHVLCRNNLPRFAEENLVQSKTVNVFWSFSSPISLRLD